MLTYRAGDADRPRGHALLFFRDAAGSDAVWATYLVVAPIAMDIGKYIPAAFAAQIPTQAMGQQPVAYPFPPVPERIEGGLPFLERLASLRGDDLLDGGVTQVSDAWQAMRPVADIGQEYARAYESFIQAAPTPIEETPRLPAVDVDDLLLQVLSDREKVGRLARLTGTLRYAVDGGDQALVIETVADMERLGQHLGEKYRVLELVAAARKADASAAELTQLYVERCYRLVEEDYAAVPPLDERIASLRAESGTN